MRANSCRTRLWIEALCNGILCNRTLVVAFFASCAISLITGCIGADLNAGDQARFTALSSDATSVRVKQQIQLTNNGKVPGLGAGMTAASWEPEMRVVGTATPFHMICAP